jgi:hypothetical protein
MNTSLKAFLKGAVCLVAFTVPAWGELPGPPAGPPRPGSINYVEGQASIGATQLAPGTIGSVVLGKDQSVTTQAGKVEILLAPGVFLRVAENSSVKMISPDLASIRVQLDKGRALVEVIQIRKENDIRIDQNGASTKLLKAGLYDFDADHARVLVFKGKAESYTGNQKVTLAERREVALSTEPGGGKPKAQGFEPRQFEDEFYRWSGLRSGYLSEASVDAARLYIGPGPGWYGPGWTGIGWYWDPWFGAYTFLPAEGIFYGPFGWGFYSPIAVYYSPFVYYHGYPHGFGEFHYPYGHGFPPQGRMGR